MRYCPSVLFFTTVVLAILGAPAALHAQPTDIRVGDHDEKAIQKLRRRVRTLEQLSTALVERVRTLKRENKQLSETTEDLTDRMARLERQVGKTSEGPTPPPGTRNADEKPPGQTSKSADTSSRAEDPLEVFTRAMTSAEEGLRKYLRTLKGKDVSNWEGTVSRTRTLDATNPYALEGGTRVLQLNVVSPPEYPGRVRAIVPLPLEGDEDVTKGDTYVLTDHRIKTVHPRLPWLEVVVVHQK
jgi:uncharacterized coiled-coil protein SlyX